MTPVRAAGATRTLATWDGPASHAVVSTTAHNGDAELFVATRGATTCTLRAFRRAPPGATDPLLWTLDIDLAGQSAEAACAAPAVAPDSASGRRALWAVGSGIVEVDLDQGQAVSRLTLASPATSPIVPLDPGANISGGGSHWLVGAVGRLDVVTRGDDGLALALSAPVSLGAELAPAEVTALAPVSGGLVAALVRTPPEAGLGAHVILMSASYAGAGAARVTGLVRLGEPIDTPSAVLTPPVTLGCGLVAGGGSHWWCPGGTVVVAGDGWVRAFDAPSGAVAWGWDDGFRYSGLSASGDGRVAGGGSHWLPDVDWELRLVGPEDPPRALATGPVASGLAPADVCVASAFIDGDGLIATSVETPAGTAWVRAPSDLAAPVEGWVRPSGDAASAGALDTGRCGDGHARGLVRIDPGDHVTGHFRDIDGFIVLAGASGDGTTPWLAWYEADGHHFDEVVPLARGATTGSPVQALTLRAKFAIVGFSQPATGGGEDLVVSTWLRSFHTATLEHVLPLGAGEHLAGLDTQDDGSTVALIDGPDASRLVRIIDAGPVVAGPVDSGLPRGAVAFEDGPDDGHLAWGPVADGAFARIYAHDLSTRATIPLAEDGRVVRVAGGVTAPDGSVVLALSVRDVARDETRGRLERYSADGVRLDATDLGLFAPRAVAVDPDGAIVSLDLGLGARRVVPGAGVGPRRPLIALAPLGLTTPVSAVMLQAPSPVGLRALVVGPVAGAGTAPAVALVALDAEGFTTCAEVGFCLATPGCVPPDACTTAGCEPTTGLCVEAPLASPDCP
ncbi:MAG: hypothetical protein U1F43_05360 [Myxococcota bacterium]